MDSRSSYVLNTFRHLYQVPDEVEIFYGDAVPANQKGIFIPNHTEHFFEGRNQVDDTNLVFKDWKNKRLPFLFEDSDEEDLIKQESGRVTIYYDIIGASFYFLSGWQEFTSPKRDEYDRFPYEQSLQYKLGAPHIPFVNYYFDILKTAIEKVYRVELTPRKVDSHPYTLVLTHDIDSVYSGWLQDGYTALQKGRVGTAIGILLQKMWGKDRWFNLNEILKFERERDVSSTFFFLPVKGERNNIKHADYALDDTAIQQTMGKIVDSGSEIGLHGDYESHHSTDAFSNNLRKFSMALKGNRFHFLMFDTHTTPAVLSASGLEYDSTLGFSEHVGFRNGYCHPFYLYDLENDFCTDVLEIPLVVMDATLQNDRYMGLVPGQAIAGIEPVIQELKQFNGTASILWHNSYFSDLKFDGWKEVLDKMIQNARDDGALVTKAETILPIFKDTEE